MHSLWLSYFRTMAAVAVTAARTSAFQPVSRVVHVNSSNALSASGPPGVKHVTLLRNAEWNSCQREKFHWYLRGGQVALSATQDSVVPAERKLAGTTISPLATQDLKSTPPMRVTFYLVVWYTLTIGYNVYNKATLNRISLPWTLSTVQMAIGTVYVGLIWATGLRKAPRLTSANMAAVAPLAFLLTIAHIAAVIGLSVGALGYFQIVKAAEPLFTALCSAVLLGQVFSWPVYAALVPVVGGVAVASMKELTFNWITFSGAIISSVSGAIRGVLAKTRMDMPKDENMDAGNIFGLMTIMSTLVLAPVALLIEGPKFKAIWSAAIMAGHTKASIIKGTVLSGLFFYIYNEVAFYCLNAIHPVTHAVANTLKRVFLIAASIIVFGHELTPLGAVGSGVAIIGVLLYSLAKQRPTTAHKRGD